MTRIRVTYVAISQDNEPIASAGTFKDLKEAIDIYYGVGKEAAKCDGWFPHDVKYPDIYEGHYKYSWKYAVGDMIDEGIDKVDVYCVDFYPHTVYEDKKEQKKLITEVMNEDGADDIPALAKQSWIPCDSCTPVDEQFYTSGFIAGYYKGQESIIPELSDEEIEEQYDLPAWVDGAKWYRKQLKQR